MALILSKNGIGKYYNISITESNYLVITLLIEDHVEHDLVIDIDSILVMVKNFGGYINIISEVPCLSDNISIKSSNFQCVINIIMNAKDHIHIYAPNSDVTFNGTFDILPDLKDGVLRLNL